MSSVPTPIGGMVDKHELSDETVITLVFVFIRKQLFANSHLEMPSWEDSLSVYFSVSQPDIETQMYVRRLVQYGHCSRSAFICAIVYLDRLRQTNSMLALTHFNLHRLYITAIMIAAKTLDDRCYSNAHYARVGGISTVQELNRLELNMLYLLKFRTYVTLEEYVSFVQQMSVHRPPSVSGCLKKQLCALRTNTVDAHYSKLLRLADLKPYSVPPQYDEYEEIDDGCYDIEDAVSQNIVLPLAHMKAPLTSKSKAGALSKAGHRDILEQNKKRVTHDGSMQYPWSARVI